MSVDVFLQAFQNGEPQQVPTGQVIACFDGFVVKRDESYIDLAFGPHDSSTIYLDTTAPTVDNLMVSRPCSDRGLAECLFRVMQLGNFILFVPGAERPILVAEVAASEIPEEMFESLGAPRITSELESFVGVFLNPS